MKRYRKKDGEMGRWGDWEMGELVNGNFTSVDLWVTIAKN
jgi:hypothetical protein